MKSRLRFAGVAIRSSEPSALLAELPLESYGAPYIRSFFRHSTAEVG